MTDERFSAFSRDPRYRLPSRKEARTSLDPRFGRLFTDDDFRKKASVDRYGRKVKAEEGREKLERLYRLEKEEKPYQDQELVAKRDPARGGGFSESESDEESTSGEQESEDEAELADETAGHEQTDQVPMGEVSRRIAVVNLDWDNIRASDILAVASSFAPNNARIEKVTVYPSEYGRERLKREEMEGPPREIFASSKRRDEFEDGEEDLEEEDEDDRIKRELLQQQVNEGNEFDTTALRQYQLERLRYYYAVIECDTEPTAKSLYDSMDGREYLSTANFFDLRFVPDQTCFDDDKPRDECTSLPEGYRPNDFRTEALMHSKVRLTWDDDDTTRKEVQKRAFSRGEIEENDLQAYIGTDSSDAESVSSRKSSAAERKARKKEEQRRLMREKLGLAVAPTARGKKDEPIGNMQITFTSGLSSGKEGRDAVFENGPQVEESTRERYIRKERERKEKRKERMKAGRGGVDAEDAEVGAEDGAPGEAEDAGFDDPFFTDPAAAAAAEQKMKKAERQKKRDARAAQDEEDALRRRELDLLMAEDQNDAVRHFNMREIVKEEKAAKRKGKKDKKNKQQSEDEDTATQSAEGGAGFKVDSADPRFKALFHSHEYAIDPTNPRYKSTEGMKTLLAEGRKKRKRGDEDVEAETSKKAVVDAPANGDDLKGLVARLKKSKSQ